MAIYAIPADMRNTVMAALRLWQEKGMHINGNVPERLYDIATDGDAHPLVSSERIDAFIEDHLNTAGVSTMEEFEAALGG